MDFWWATEFLRPGGGPRDRPHDDVGLIHHILEAEGPGAALWLDEVRTALAEQHAPSAKETLALHQAEIWRDRLIADDDAVGQWITLCPSTDSQQLRALIRQARKDAKPEKPGAAVRHGRAYRDIFQLVREALIAAAEQPDARPSAHLDSGDVYTP